MAKVDRKLLDIDLDVVEDSNGHKLMREGAQNFDGLKTFQSPPRSEMYRAEANNTAVTKAMLMNATRCVNEFFMETLTVTAEDIADGFIPLSKDIPSGKESSLEIVSFEGAGPMVCGVDYGAATNRLIFAGYPLANDIKLDDEITVRYMVCADMIVTMGYIVNVTYAPELGRFICVCNGTEAPKDEPWLSASRYLSSIFWSDDGKNWTEAEIDGDISDFKWEKTIWAARLWKFYAYGNGSVLLSNDGKTWTKRETEVTPHCYADSRIMFLALIGESGDLHTYISSNGIDWTEHTSEFDDNVSGYVHGNSISFDNDHGYFICMLYGSTDGGPGNQCYAMRSHDGIHWVTFWDNYGSCQSDIAIGEQGGSQGVRVFLYTECTSWNENDSTFEARIVALPRNVLWGVEYEPLYAVFDDVIWCDEINIFIVWGLNDPIFISNSGVNWWMLPDITLNQPYLCWAGNKDMMLTYSGYTIEVHDNFTSNIRGVRRVPVSLRRIREWRPSGTIEWHSDGTWTFDGGSDVEYDLPDPNDYGMIDLPYPKFPRRNITEG